MTKHGTLEFTGESGTKYTFTAYSSDTTWKKIAAVYAVTRRTEKIEGGASHKHIYIGQTEDMEERHGNHHKADCFAKHKANCICVFVESSEKKRLKIESDILDGDKTWPCND